MVSSQSKMMTTRVEREKGKGRLAPAYYVVPHDKKRLLDHSRREEKRSTTHNTEDTAVPYICRHTFRSFAWWWRHGCSALVDNGCSLCSLGSSNVWHQKMKFYGVGAKYTANNECEPAGSVRPISIGFTGFEFPLPKLNITLIDRLAVGAYHVDSRAFFAPRLLHYVARVARP